MHRGDRRHDQPDEDGFETMKLDAIAVIGMAGRFPGAPDVAQFWRNLAGGVESITFFSRAELARRGVAAELLDDPLYVKAGAVLDGIETFDADFFGFTPREAEIVDPQHRVFLECAWEALEDSGYDPESYDGQIGIYAGAGPSTYLLNYLMHRGDVLRSVGALQLQLGNNKDYVPLRVSYKLHLRGPSVNVNTACSSSLVAVHLACQSLIDHQCDIALAGGVGIQVPQNQGYLYAPNGITSPDGHCRAFDAGAQGTVGGNGAGIVVLKRYGEALADRDAIRAVILGSAVNNDGGKKVGFTAPSVDGQSRVIHEALAIAEVDPATLGYVEAHGTGTPLGDPIEVAALTEVIRSYTSQSKFCALGSVKTNIGHLDEAAGVTGLIKTVLALERAEIPPSLHFERPNPEIDFEHSPFYVPTRLSLWEGHGAPRRAGVSSFGIGGTNAHVVLQEAPLLEPASPSRPWQLLLLSARTKTALDALIARLAGHLRTTPGIRLADVVYTLHVGRKDFPYRGMVLCRDLDEAVKSLESRQPDRCATALIQSKERSLVFLFPGQGSQHCDMGLGLYRTEPLFRDTVDRCADLLTPELGFDVRTVLYPESERAGEAAVRLEQTAVAQPALFTVEYALAQLLISWGICPQAMSGHSIGEYVAACLAGVFSWEDGLSLVAARGRLMQQMPAGGMLAVELAEDDLLPLLGEGVSLALVNAPSLCVLAGKVKALDALQEKASVWGIACRRLHTSHAFHSESMDPMLEPFAQRVREVSLSAPTIPYVSNLTGQWITAREATDPDYWTRHLRNTVRFSQGIRQLLKREGHVFLEVGPGQTLSALVRRHPECTPEHPMLGTMRHPHDPREDSACLLEAVGRLWLAGACRKPAGFHTHEKRRRVALPTYPFERRRFWLEPRSEDAVDSPESKPVEASRKGAVEDWFYVPSWKRRPAQMREETKRDSWVVFLDSCGLGLHLVKRFRDLGRRVFCVTAGSAFARHSDASYTLNPRQPDDYRALLRELDGSGCLPRNIIHLWTFTRASASPADHWDDTQYLGFYSLLFLVQAASREGMAEGLSVHAVSSNMQLVVGHELLCPEKATLLGLVRVAPKEFPGIRCRSIDLVLPDSEQWDEERCIDPLMSELLSEDSAPVIAIRGDSVWEQVFAPRHLPAPAATPARLRERGIYLITGGLGSMGLALARYLAREVRARLVLLGRSGLPPEAEWDERLHAAEPNAGKIRGTAAPLPRTLDFDLTVETDLIGLLEAEALADSAVKLIEGDERLQQLLRAFCSGLIGRYFGECGVALKKGRIYALKELRNRLDVLPAFEKFLAFLLGSLAQDGIVGIDGDRVEILKHQDPANLAEVRQTILSDYPDFHGLVKLLDHCAGRYRRALSGEIPSISVLYPDGTSALLDECYRDTPEYTGDGVYLKVASRLLARIVSKTAAGKLRILEVGGGTGGLTRHVLEALRGRAFEYYFTDVGQSFVRMAENEAAANGIDFMRFGVLDVSRDPEYQGYARHGFDIVLGYNVVHATRRIEETVGHLRRLLAPGGLLMLVESTRVRRWDEMVWGLTAGWWHFTDENLRTDSPLIGLDAWEKLMRSQGFDAVAAYPREKRARLSTDTGLVLAQGSRNLAENPQRVTGEAGENAKARAAIAAVRNIRSLGGEVHVIRADVADEAEMRAALSEVREHFGTPDGIIHTAGVLGQGPILGKTLGDIQKVFAPKAFGVLVLDRVLKDQGIEPDFLILCSSLASVAPIVGQADYCAANTFLDSYAAYRTGLPGRTATISIDWGFWQELGMIEQAKMPQASKQRIVEEIREKGRSDAGVEVFRCILGSCPPPQVLVVPDNADSLVPVNGPGCHLELSPAAVVPEEPPDHRLVHHPWFDDCLVQTAEIEAYVSHLDIRHWVLDEHRPMGKAVLPGTAFLELARAALEAHGPGKPVQLSDVYFLAPLVVEDDETKEVRTILTKRDASFEFVIVSRSETDVDAWHEHARGEIAFLTVEPPSPHDLGDLERRCQEADITIPDGEPGGNVHAFAERVRHFTPHWRNFERIRLGVSQGLATLRLSSEFAREPDTLVLHPALTDMGTGFMSMVDGFESGVPFSYKRVRLWKPLQSRVHSHVRAVENRQPGGPTYDATILDGQGNVLLDVVGFALREFGHQRADGLQAVAVSEDKRNFCLEIERPGSLGTLSLQPDMRRRPRPGEVEIEVAAAGLNFIEVLSALGMLPEPPGEDVRFGLECAGRITAVGDGVGGFSLGDEIFGLAPRAFSRFTTTAATAIARKPEHLTLREAATLPIAFATAYYSLITRGRIRRGERVLIHAASGGVGLAALNIAEWRGAEIFATAGTAEKREYLRSLGIRHVWNSRTVDFAGRVLEVTNGQGVDVVLNSLGGEFIKASLSVLARYGRFLELGKRNILWDTALGLAPFEKHLSFVAIALSTDLPQFEVVWRQVVRAVRRRAFRPLPYREFPIRRAAEAFEYMAQAKHIGKVVVAVDGVDPRFVDRLRRKGRPLDDIVGRGVAFLSRARPVDKVRFETRASEADVRMARFDPSHTRPALPTAYRPPTGEMESTVVDIWQELLGVAGIGVDDNFFELRGDSLLAAQVTSRLYRAFQVKLPLSDIFEHPTAAGLASRVEQRRRSVRELATAPSSLPGEREVEQEL
jgi:acyl transferase domain-containing protein/NADPH:quinone reductase-like Zn-dependent oxidoreductase